MSLVFRQKAEEVLPQNSLLGVICNSGGQHPAKGDSAFEIGHIRAEEHAVRPYLRNAKFQNGAVALRAGDIKVRIWRFFCHINCLLIASPRDAGVSQQNASVRKFLGDFGEQERPAVRIRVPRVYKHDGMGLMRIVPGGEIVRTGNRVLVQIRMELDQRRMMEIGILLQLLERPSPLGLGFTVM